MHRIAERRLEPLADQRVDLPQERRERLSRARRRENERVFPLGDRRPPTLLWRARHPKGLTKPFAYPGMKAAERRRRRGGQGVNRST